MDGGAWWATVHGVTKSQTRLSDFTFFLTFFGFGKCSGASSQSSYWVGHCWLSYKVDFTLHVVIWSRSGSLLLRRIKEDSTSKQFFFFILGQLTRYPFIELFHLSNLLQMLNNLRMDNIEFFGNFSCSYKRISFSDALSWSLSTSSGHPLHSSSSRLSFPLQKLEPPLHGMFISSPGPNVLLMLWVVSAALLPILDSNKKIGGICFLSNIISIV